jgi:hypothetical protein
MTRIKKAQVKGAQLHPTENQIQIAAVEYCWHVHRVTAVHSPNELMRFLNDGQKIFMARMGVRTGFSDLVIFEARGCYHGLVIEIKTNPKSKISDEQKYWILYLNQRGYYAKICIGLDDTLDTIEEYLQMNELESMLIQGLGSLVLKVIEDKFGSRVTDLEKKIEELLASRTSDANTAS